MLSRLVPAAAIAALCGALSAAQAQGVREFATPLETPPTSFKGQQFVDGRGCVYIRAGIDGQTAWVPRVGADRKVLCGYPPTFGKMAEAPAPVAPVAAAAEPAPAPVAVAPAPAAATAPAPVRVAETAAVSPADTHGYVDTPRATGTPGQIACPDRAPYAERLPLRGGGTILLCLSRPGLLDEKAVVLGSLATPAAGANTVLACPSNAPVAQRLPQKGGGSALLCTAGDGRTAGLALPQAKTAAAPARALAIDIPAPTPDPRLVNPIIPPGYKLAWSDGRLNPYRGKGSMAGQQAQDRIWTRTVPAELVEWKPAETVQVASASAPVRATRSATPTLVVSTKSPDAKAATPGRSFVQVGSFGQPSNADAARLKISALGMPVAGSRVTSGGKALQVVLAGPFDDPAQARNALASLRQAGFPDAILKQ